MKNWTKVLGWANIITAALVFTSCTTLLALMIYCQITGATP